MHVYIYVYMHYLIYILYTYLFKYAYIQKNILESHDGGFIGGRFPLQHQGTNR